MALPNNLKLLILSFSLLAVYHSAQSDLSPAVSPPKPNSSPESSPVQSPSPGPATEPADGPTAISPEPADGPTPISSPSPSPAEAKDLSNDVASPPSIDSDPPSTSISPVADGPTESDDWSTDSDDESTYSDDGPTVSDVGSTKSDDGFMVNDVGSTVSNDGNDGPDLSFSTIFSQSSQVNPKVKEICDSTDHPALCLATVVPFLKGKDDIPSVLEVVIDAGAKLSNYGLTLTKSLAEKPDTPPEVVSVLNDCKESYDTAVTNFQNTIDAFRERDIGTMNSMLSAVITDVEDCEDGFSGLGEKSMLSDLAGKLTNITSNCLAIVSLLR